MMVPGKRKAVLAAAGLILTAVLSGCSIGGPTGQQRADELATQLERSELGVSSAEATYLTSFSGDLTVSVVLDPDGVQPGYTVFAETLGPILGMVAQSAKQMNVGGVGFYAEDDGGIHVSMVQAADELGIAEAVDGSSLSLTGERLEILAKQ